MARILVIDDDETILFTLRKMLEKAGHQVQEAKDGKQGIQLFRKAPADVVVTDIVMPEKEGMETIWELRQGFPEAKIIAISGGGVRSRENYLTTALKLGAHRAISKPVDMKQLLTLVQELLEEKDSPPDRSP